MPRSSRKRILIVAVNWLGDLLFMTPAIRAIRKAHPESFIACLAHSRGVEFLEGNPHLNQVIPLQEGRGWRQWFRWFSVVRQLRALEFDAAYLFHRSFTRAVAAWASGIPERIGYRTWKRGWLLTVGADPPPKDSIHKVEWFLRVLDADAVPRDGLEYDAGLLREDQHAAQTILREMGVGPQEKFVVLHAGGNWRLKRWPADRFARLGDLLEERCGVRVVLIGADGDRPLIEKISRGMKTQPLLAVGQTTFRQLGALLAQASLLVSNDSGPLHLGLAVGTPAIALFGPTDPQLTGPPQGSRTETFFGSIGCPVPCYQLRCPVNLCMHQIGVEQVFAAAETLLKGDGFS